MSGTHARSAEDVFIITIWWLLSMCQDKKEDKWKHRTLLKTFTKTPLPEEVDENTGIYMADKHLFYVQNVHCTRKKAVSSHCAANERFNFI